MLIKANYSHVLHILFYWATQKCVQIYWVKMRLLLTPCFYACKGQGVTFPHPSTASFIHKFCSIFKRLWEDAPCFKPFSWCFLQVFLVMFLFCNISSMHFYLVYSNKKNNMPNARCVWGGGNTMVKKHQENKKDVFVDFSIHCCRLLFLVEVLFFYPSGENSFNILSNPAGSFKCASDWNVLFEQCSSGVFCIHFFMFYVWGLYPFHKKRI